MKIARFAITALAIALGVVIVWAAFHNAQPNQRPASVRAVSESTAQPEATAAKPDLSESVKPGLSESASEGPEDATSPPESGPSSSRTPRQVRLKSAQTPAKTPAAIAASQVHVKPIPGLHVVAVEYHVVSTKHESGEQAKDRSLGSIDPNSDYDMLVKLAPWGAGIKQIALTHFHETARGKEPYVIQHLLQSDKTLAYPYAARSITVNGQEIDLFSAGWRRGAVKRTAKGSSVQFSLTLADGSNKPAVELLRTYVLPKHSYDLELRQQVVNHTGEPIKVVWAQYAQGDLQVNQTAYLGDRRQFAAAYFNPSYNPGRTRIFTTDAFVSRSSMVGKDHSKLWPNPSLAKDAELAWLAGVNRYFAMVTHPIVPAGATSTAAIPPLEKTFPHITTVVFPDHSSAKGADQNLVLSLATDTLVVKPGQSVDLSLAAYAGPRQTSVLNQPPNNLLDLGQLVRYELSCTWCTFQWLAHSLLWILKLIEGHILVLGGMGIGVHDWGVAIVILVIVVRLLLHPLTKRAQISMMKMGKQMQTLQPELEKLKKKYADDQTKLNQEMMKLYREKGINPANMLGCLPMFLQTPIWIALDAILYYAIELRHEPAFYGVFQAISGGHWRFLADLSTADHFIWFGGHGVTLNLIFIHPTFAAVNLLPLLMGAVFFFQQKYMTPPPANEQQAQQQKIMRFMPLIMPVFLYSAPSGLNLYICASSTAGMIDSYFIRKHVKEQEDKGLLFQKKERKPGGIMDTLQKTLAAKQEELARKQQGGKSGVKHQLPRSARRKQRKT